MVDEAPSLPGGSAEDKEGFAIQRGAQHPAATAVDATPRRLSWRMLIAGLFALNIATGALTGKHPSDLYWISSSVAQVGIMAALVLALVVPGFAFLRTFLSRLNDLNELPVHRAIAAHLGLGAVATLGGFVGRAGTGDPPYSGPLEFAVLFPVGTISAALIFLLTARLFFHRAGREAALPKTTAAETRHG